MSWFQFAVLNIIEYLLLYTFSILTSFTQNAMIHLNISVRGYNRDIFKYHSTLKYLLKFQRTEKITAASR